MGYATYCFTRDLENAKEFKAWKSENLQSAIIHFINQKYSEDEFLEKFICPISNQIIEEPVLCYGSFYEHAELLKQKDPMTGIIQDPKKNGQIHAKDLHVDPYIQFLIAKRIEWCLENDLKQQTGNKETVAYLQSVLHLVQERSKTVYTLESNRVEAMRTASTSTAINTAHLKRAYLAAHTKFVQEFGLQYTEMPDWEKVGHARPADLVTTAVDTRN